MEWPYDHPRRGEMPPGHHALSLNEYTIRQPPYAADSKYPKVYSYVQGWSGTDYSKNIVVDEKDHPYTGTNYAWVRARLPRRQDEHLGPAGAAALGLRLQGEEPRRLRRGLADLLQGHRAVLRPGRPVPRDLGRQGEPPASARQHLPAADPARERGSHAAQVAEEDEPRPDALSRRRHDRRPEAQQVPQPLLRPRRVQPPRRRLRHPRGLRLADRPDLSGDGHRAT